MQGMLRMVDLQLGMAVLLVGMVSTVVAAEGHSCTNYCYYTMPGVLVLTLLYTPCLVSLY